MGGMVFSGVARWLTAAGVGVAADFGMGAGEAATVGVGTGWEAAIIGFEVGGASSLVAAVGGGNETVGT